MAIHPDVANRVRRFISQASQLSPRLQEVFHSARVSLMPAFQFRPGATMEIGEVIELSAGAGKNPPQIIFVDDSNEGYLPKRYKRGVSDLAEQLDIPPDRVIILTQNEYFRNPGVSKSTTVSVNSSVFNRQFRRAYAETRRLGRARFHRPWSIRDRRRFLSLNNVPRAHRIALAPAMKEAGLLSQTAFSFHSSTHLPEKNLEHFVNEARAIFPEHIDAIDRFLAETPFPVQLDGPRTRQDVGSLPPVARHCLWFLVTETNFPLRDESLRVRRVTEKTMKALVFGRPFVLVGNPFTLDYLHELGFSTFGSIIDESYDGMTNPNERMEAILALVSRLAARKTTRTLVKELSAVVRANHAWLLGGFIPHIRQREVRSLEEAIDRAGL